MLVTESYGSLIISHMTTSVDPRMAAAQHVIAMRRRYQLCFRWYRLLDTTPEEDLPGVDIPHLQAELREFGLPLPSEPFAGQKIAEARQILDDWLLMRSLDYMYEHAQHCPHC